jgi:hypothetical protein
MDEKKNIEEILNFKIPQEFVSEFSDEEIEIFNFKLFESLMDKIILSLSGDLDEKNKEKILELMKNKKIEPQEILEFLIKNNTNSLEKIGEIIFEHKKTIKKFIESN